MCRIYALRGKEYIGQVGLVERDGRIDSIRFDRSIHGILGANSIKCQLESG